MTLFPLAMGKRRKSAGIWKRLGRLAFHLGLALAVLVFVVPLLLMALYRVVPPPLTPLMVLRLFEGEGIEKEWRPLRSISSHVPAAVIAAEDNRFCQHSGIDWGAINTAIEEYRDGGQLRGASTISMQTAKNLFLWPGRSFIRKGLEATYTLMLDALWPKRRILEVYLNIVEWGAGVYGIEAAARHHFDKSADALGRSEAARLAALLPNPRKRSASPPSPIVASTANDLEVRIGQLGPLLDCARAPSQK